MSACVVSRAFTVARSFSFDVREGRAAQSEDRRMRSGVAVSVAYCRCQPEGSGLAHHGTDSVRVWGL